MFFKRLEKGKWWHRHEFMDVLENASAFYGDKRNLPEGKVPFFRGTLRKCSGCSQLRFQVPGLYEVEVVLA